jgi:AcrR family transcriptional regulator
MTTPTDPNGPLIWERLEAAPAGTGLSLPRIVRGALEIAAKEGIEGLSMRGIAAKLGCGAMSLYRHVADKDEVLDLLLNEVYGEVLLPARASGDWRADLALVARQTRAALARHPWLAWVLSNRPPSGPNYLRCWDFSLGVLAARGLPMAEAVRQAGLLTTYVVGFVARELAAGEAERRGEWGGAAASARMAAGGRFPHVARALAEGAPAADALTDAAFELGLACLLDGLAGRPAPAAS